MLFALLFVAAGCPTDTVAVLHHDTHLSLELSPRQLLGEGDMRVRALKATSVVALDARELRVLSAASGGKSLSFTQGDNRVCIKMFVAAGEDVSLQLRWSVPTNGEMPHFGTADMWAGYETDAWMPTVFNSAERATLDLTIDAPSELEVAGPGQRVASTRVGERIIHRFRVSEPKPPFMFAFAAGYFEDTTLTVGKVTLHALAPPGVDTKPALAATATALKFLAGHLLAPYPLPEYTQVFVQGDAAQEAVGLAIIGAQALGDLKTDPTDDWVFTHELAHQWFGVAVPCATFGDFWLNEGFATFMVGAEKQVRAQKEYDEELANWRVRSAKAHAAGKDAPISLTVPGAPPADDHHLQARGVTYFRGALVLDKLRRELGDEAFWRGLQQYVRDAPALGVRTEDLRSAFEHASGRDLKAFFVQWIYAAVSGL